MLHKVRCVIAIDAKALAVRTNRTIVSKLSFGRLVSMSARMLARTRCLAGP